MIETAQPDPQVVAWMRGYALQIKDAPEQTRKLRTIKAYREAHPECFMRIEPLVDAYREAARRPLTVADIPAGQGSASLYVDAESTAIRYRTANGRSVVVPAGWVAFDNDERDALNAALDRLAATLPTVTPEDAP